MSFRTSVGTSDADSITVMGRDLSGDLMGQTTLTELTFLMVQRRPPTPEETRLFDAVLVSLAEHGMTPTPRGSPTRGRPSRSRARSPPASWGPAASSSESSRTRFASWTSSATT